MKIVGALFVILAGIEGISSRLPEIQLSVANRHPLRICNHAADHDEVARVFTDQIATDGNFGRPGNVKWAKKDRRGALR